MAILYRRRTLAVGGLVEDNPLTSGATTLNSAGLQPFPTLGTDEYFPIIFDPDGIDGAPEVAYITAHTSGAGTATISRGLEGTTARACDRDTPWIHGPTTRDYDGKDGGDGLIGFKSYSQTGNYTTTSATFADVDATNLVVAFTGPPAGKVLVRLTGVAGGTATGNMLWNLRDAGGNITGTRMFMVGNMNMSVCGAVLVTGLTPGTAYSWKWGFASSTAGQTCTMFGTTAQGADEPWTMEIWAVNC